jgi:dihydroorotate dehydrogenase (NAD+) catalytic subunit
MASVLETSLCGITLHNPFILASGIRDLNSALLVRAAKEGAGAVTSKSVSLAPRLGHPNPTVVFHGGIMLNAVGLSGPGIDAEIKELKAAKRAAGVPIIASVFAQSVEDFYELAYRISEAEPEMIEVNISCPNVANEGRMFSACAPDAADVTHAVKKATSIPISIKLSPNVTDIAEIAHAVEAAGADCITAINTVGGMFIDPIARRPLLSNKVGGLSGSLIKPVALKAVWEIRRRGVKIPVIGTGGISVGKDAAEMFCAGANAIGVGTAAMGRENLFSSLCLELEKFMSENNYRSLKDLKLIEDGSDASHPY